MSETKENGRIVVHVDKDIEDLIPEYLELTKNDVATMRGALARSDFATLRSIGHTMKGSGGAYGFDSLTSIGGTIETLAKGGVGEELGKRIAELETYLDSVDIVFE